MDLSRRLQDLDAEIVKVKGEVRTPERALAGPGPSAYRGGNHAGNHGRHHGGNHGYRGTRYLWGPGVAFYFYDGYYHGDCGWLRRKAHETGSAYWHRRLRQCRNA